MTEAEELFEECNKLHAAVCDLPAGEGGVFIEKFILALGAGETPKMALALAKRAVAEETKAHET